MTDCYCDYEPADFYHSTVRVARKSYVCRECDGAIAARESYEYVFGVWCGDAQTYRTCMRCRDIRQWVQNNIPCLCWGHGNLIEDCRDAVIAAVDRAPNETRGLKFGFLRMVAALKQHNRQSNGKVAA